MKKNTLILAFTSSLLVIGCGGSSSVIDQLVNSDTTITGTAATGLAISGGSVRGHCKNGAATATTNADGTYTLTLPSGTTKPCVLRVTSGSTTLYSAVHENQSTSNITPVTNMIVANALGDDPANAFASAASGTPPVALTEANMNSAKTVVAAALTSLGITLPNGADPLTSNFVATNGNTSGDGLDTVLDRLTTVLTNANVTIAQASVAIKTADASTVASMVQTAAPTGTTITPYTNSSYTSVPTNALAVSLAGNGYITKTVTNGTENIPYSTTASLQNWSSANAIASVYVDVTSPGTLEIGIEGSLETAGNSTIQVTARGKTFPVSLTSTTSSKIVAGSVSVPTAGYIKIDLQGVSKSGATFGKITNLNLSGSATTGLIYAKTPDSNASTGYYWLRRGASTYINYNNVPSGTRYFYNEITVPTGFDPRDSYYEVNGFSLAQTHSGGYAGMQVVDNGDRWILFSVWDPKDTNDVVACDRTVQARDATKCTTIISSNTSLGVVATEFANEGSGAKSYVVYPWVAGSTYKFVTKAEASGANTLITTWFYAPTLDSNRIPTNTWAWQHIATFKYPGINTTLTGLFSFDECFSPNLSYLPRKMILSNQWASADGSNWTEVKTATFTATGESSERYDFAGGLSDSPTSGTNNAFYMVQGGFFNNDGTFNSNVSSQMKVPSAPYTTITRNSSGLNAPSDAGSLTHP